MLLRQNATPHRKNTITDPCKMFRKSSSSTELAFSGTKLQYFLIRSTSKQTRQNYYPYKLHYKTSQCFLIHIEEEGGGNKNEIERLKISRFLGTLNQQDSDFCVLVGNYYSGKQFKNIDRKAEIITIAEHIAA